MKEKEECTNVDYYTLTIFNDSSELGQTISPKLVVVIFWLLLELTQKYITLAASYSQIKINNFFELQEIPTSSKSVEDVFKPEKV